MYLNGFKNYFRVIDHTILKTEQNICSFPGQTSDESSKYRNLDFWAFILFDFEMSKTRNMF